MNPGKIARLQGRLAQVEATAAKLREAIKAAQAKADAAAELETATTDDVEVVEAVAPTPKRQASRASKRAEG